MKKYSFYFMAFTSSALSLVANIMLVLFIGNLGLISGIDSHRPGWDSMYAFGLNMALLLLFGFQHSFMARDRFKNTICKILPSGLERVIYVLVSSLVLILMISNWKAMPYVIWEVRIEWARVALYALFFLGILLTFTAQFQHDINELAGLNQVKEALRGNDKKQSEFSIPFLYKFVRHPLYLGMLIAFWSAPIMTVSHLLFSLGMTIYVFIGIHFEEKDLVKRFGKLYENYRESTPKLFPNFRHVEM